MRLRTARASPDSAREPGADRTDGRIVRTATEARQGDIVLDGRGRWVWIAAFVLLAIALSRLAA